jgi:uncharacterized protein YdcH (DUF465 family)
MPCAIARSAVTLSARRRAFREKSRKIFGFLPLMTADESQRENNMQVDHHDLHHEFPEMNDAINALTTGNAHFARLCASYNRLTGKVEDLEEHDMPVADFTIEDMKKQRVKLKDEIYHMLLAYRAGQRAARG